MAGHSKFKNIMHRKGAQDKKRAKTFSRLGKEIAVAVKTSLGSNPSCCFTVIAILILLSIYFVIKSSIIILYCSLVFISNLTRNLHIC